MAKIPRFQQTSIFQPQTTKAPTQGFQTVEQVLGKAEGIFEKLSTQQIQADKVVGSNQIQNSIRQLQADATLKFPGDYTKQKEFVNQGSQSFLAGFIPNSHVANRGYFKAISNNVLTNANFKFSRHIEAQNLKNQKAAVNAMVEQNFTNTLAAIRNGNTQLKQDNIGQIMIGLDNAVKGSVLSPAEQQAFHQRMLVGVHLAGAKNQIDNALAHGGIDEANAKFREIIGDKKNAILLDPKTEKPFTSELRSYKNGVTTGLKSSQAANKDLQKDVLNNTRLTGQFDTQKVHQLGLEEKNAQALDVHNKSWEIFTSSPLDRQKQLSALRGDERIDVGVKKTVQEFDAQYNKNPMDFLLNQISKTQHGVDLANATPEQMKQMRSSAVEIQRQRQDFQVKPATQLDMAPVVAAARSGNLKAFTQSYDAFQNSMGKFSQSGLIQLGKELVKNGVDSSVEEIGYLENQKGEVGLNIIEGATQDLKTLREATATRLGVTPQELSQNLRDISSEWIVQSPIFSTPANEKFISSLRNGGGSQSGLVLGGHQQNMERYMLSTVSNGRNPSFEEAAKQYSNGFANSFHYDKQRNGQYVRIPKAYQGRPLDQNEITTALKAQQSNVQMKDVDLSQVRLSPLMSQELAQQRYWNENGSYNHWVNSPDGESYFLMDNTNKTINWKSTGKPIRLRISDIVSDVVFFRGQK